MYHLGLYLKGRTIPSVDYYLVILVVCFGTELGGAF